MNLNATPSNCLSPAELPHPGEIWSLKRLSHAPPGLEPDRYVMIVNTQMIDESMDLSDRRQTDRHHQTESILSGMLLSTRTDYLSEVDILIPADITGLDQDILAETWHVFSLSESNLSHRVGLRLSRQIYDVLLTVGDAYHGLVDRVPSHLDMISSDLEELGLKMGSMSVSHPNLQSFRQEEEAWSAILAIPFTTDRSTQRALKFAEVLLEEAKQWEQDWIELYSSHPESVDPEQPVVALVQQPNVLSRWFQKHIEPEWQKINYFWELQPVGFGMVRSAAELQINRSANPAEVTELEITEFEITELEIAELLQQLASSQDESLHQSIVKRLGMIAVGHPDAIQAIIAILDHTLNDETLWIAVESLNRIDPGNLVNISRFKTIDLGMQVLGQSVRLVVSLFQKANQQVSVLLRVYPSETEYFLPPDLKLILRDLAGQVLHEVTARSSDLYIQLKLSGYQDEAFCVKIALREASITESFLI